MNTTVHDPGWRCRSGLAAPGGWLSRTLPLHRSQQRVTTRDHHRIQPGIDSRLSTPQSAAG